MRQLIILEANRDYRHRQRAYLSLTKDLARSERNLISNASGFGCGLARFRSSRRQKASKIQSLARSQIRKKARLWVTQVRKIS